MDLTTWGEPMAPDAFRRFMSSLPAGVCVVTSLDADGAPVGATSSSVCGVSLDPPLVLTCLDRESRTLQVLLERDGFVVNLLRHDAMAVAQRFASRDVDKFDGLPYVASPAGLPVLGGHVVEASECQVHAVVPAGDHVIVVGRLGWSLRLPGQTDALVYHRRGYSAAGQSTAV